MPPCKIDPDFSTFKNQLHSACRRHRTLQKELEIVFTELEQNYEIWPQHNDRIPDLGDIHIRKIRIGVTKDRIPPSKGYRLIFQIVEVGGQVFARCLSLYYKQDRSNIGKAELADLLKKWKAQREA